MMTMILGTNNLSQRRTCSITPFKIRIIDRHHRLLLLNPLKITRFNICLRPAVHCYNSNHSSNQERTYSTRNNIHRSTPSNMDKVRPLIIHNRSINRLEAILLLLKAEDTCILKRRLEEGIKVALLHLHNSNRIRNNKRECTTNRLTMVVPSNIIRIPNRHRSNKCNPIIARVGTNCIQDSR